MQEQTPIELRPVSENSNKNITSIIYLLQILFFVTGITAIIAVIINYIKIDDVRGTWLESHFRWQIRTFWFALLWAAIGCILLIILIGHLVLIANGIWYIYRVIKGWIYLYDNKPMYKSMVS